MCQSVFSQAAWVGVRDKDYSAKQLDITVHFAVDDAVYLPVRHDEQTKKIATEHKHLVGLSLRHFKGVTPKHHENLCRSFAEYAQKNNKSTVFLPHHAADNMGDLEIARNVANLWGEGSPFLILDPVPCATAVKAVTQECSLVVTMRYHQLIFSLSVGVPVIGIYVEEYTQAKLKGAFEQFGLKPLLLSIEEASHKLHDLIEAANSRKDDFKKAALITVQESIVKNLRPYEKAAEITGVRCK